jgi:hypothetical protein
MLKVTLTLLDVFLLCCWIPAMIRLNDPRWMPANFTAGLLAAAVAFTVWSS